MSSTQLDKLASVIRQRLVRPLISRLRHRLDQIRPRRAWHLWCTLSDWLWACCKYLTFEVGCSTRGAWAGMEPPQQPSMQQQPGSESPDWLARLPDMPDLGADDSWLQDFAAGSLASPIVNKCALRAALWSYSRSTRVLARQPSRSCLMFTPAADRTAYCRPAQVPLFLLPPVCPGLCTERVLRGRCRSYKLV